MFELTKAKLEARRAKREAIIKLDLLVNNLTSELQTCTDEKVRQDMVDTITKIVILRDCYRKGVELPKWAAEAVSFGFKLLGLVAGAVTAEVMMNRGSGDKIWSNTFTKIGGL